MSASQVRASFDLDCAARPCLAVFAGQVPSEEQRASVLRQLHESQPDLELMSTTIILALSNLFEAFELGERDPLRELEDLIEAIVRKCCESLNRVNLVPHGLRRQRVARRADSRLRLTAVSFGPPT